MPLVRYKRDLCLRRRRLLQPAFIFGCSGFCGRSSSSAAAAAAAGVSSPAAAASAAGLHLRRRRLRRPRLPLRTTIAAAVSTSTWRLRRPRLPLPPHHCFPAPHAPLTSFLSLVSGTCPCHTPPRRDPCPSDPPPPPLHPASFPRRLTLALPGFPRSET